MSVPLFALYTSEKIIILVFFGAKMLKSNVRFRKRPYPESNGDASKGRGFEPRAIPLCDMGNNINRKNWIFKLIVTLLF